jgi:hypothetical protein
MLDMLEKSAGAFIVGEAPLPHTPMPCVINHHYASIAARFHIECILSARELINTLIHALCHVTYIDY